MQDAPSAAEIAAMPEVIQAIELAWVDSEPDNASKRHEEGGWIYWDPKKSVVAVVRVKRGARAGINFENPPVLKTKYLIAKFHTHPNPSAEGWNTGPSESDMMFDELDGVPDLIRADDGIHVSGPERRRGGLRGNPGYPEQEKS